MAHDRPRRVAQLIQEELGRIMLRGFKDERISGFLTITGVRASPDLKTATIYYSVLGSDEDREATAEGLVAATNFIRREISKNLRLRFTPNLRFVYDEAIERGDRIERLLKEARGEASEDDPGEPEEP